MTLGPYASFIATSYVLVAVVVALLIGWLLAVQTMLGDLANQATFNSILILLELLSIIVFVGGFAVMLWYASVAWRSGWRWPGKAWSVLLVIASGMVLYIALVFKLISLTTNY